MTIAFDLDDTLYPEIEFVRSAYREIARRYNHPELAELMYHASTPREAFDLATRVIGLPDATALIEIYRNHLPDISLRPEVESTLLALKNRGITMALITDGRSTTQRNKIAALRLERFFDSDLIFISGETGGDKTTGLPFCLTEKAASSGPYFYVADNPAKDFFQARQRGWTTIIIMGKKDNIHSQDLSSVAEDFKPHRIIYSVEKLAQMADS
ncbi:MAG: HAD hydrolase-like protein [Bacteroides sp.]|nr:HAD hydrolase-like protein [Barnesiella sp.]MBD5368998.1 HAD hydrolase-like protein [Bacteroides sp.]